MAARYSSVTNARGLGPGRPTWRSRPGSLAVFVKRASAIHSSYDESVKFAHALALALLAATNATAQIIEFESGGLKYQALTHNSVTVMFSPLPLHIKGYAVIQVAISNGAPVSWSVRPEDFRFEKAGGGAIQALAARTVVDSLFEKASRGDVIKLVAAYEASLYNNAQIHSTNGYEARRQNAFADLGSNRLKAAAAASAISMVTTKLAPGQSTDGAVFFASGGKPLGTGRLVVNTAGEVFVFPVEGERSGTAK
jgi:hypothetical protein